MFALFQSASGLSSKNCPSNSCLPNRVPSYFEMIVEMKTGERFLKLSWVLPLVVMVEGLPVLSVRFSRSIKNLVGLGVEVTIQRGFGPFLNPISKLSKVSSTRFHLATSSNHKKSD